MLTYELSPKCQCYLGARVREGLRQGEGNGNLTGVQSAQILGPQQYQEILESRSETDPIHGRRFGKMMPAGQKERLQGPSEKRMMNQSLTL